MNILLLFGLSLLITSKFKINGSKHHNESSGWQTFTSNHINKRGAYFWLTLLDCPLRRTFNIRNFRNSIFALESANICWASANNFLSRPWWAPLIDCIIFSAPFFTFISIFNCFSNDISSLSFGVSSFLSSVSVIKSKRNSEN